MPASTLGQRLLGVRHRTWLVVLEVATTAYAASILAVVELTIRWVPLLRLSRLLGCPVGLSPVADAPPIGSSHELGRRGRRELRCAHRVTDAWPLSQGPCLRRALVGGHLLRRLGTRIRLGTYDDADQVVAHAWLEIDGRPLEDVTDYRHFERTGRNPVEEPSP